MQFCKAPRRSADRTETHDRPALMDKLESRVYFAHLGHEVFLPDAAANGANGLEVVESTYTFANHRRGKLIVGADV